jgi:hypothetical protein
MLNYKKNISLIGLCLFCIVVVSPLEVDAGVLGNRKLTTPSEKKIIYIEKMVERTLAQNAKSEDYTGIKKALLEEVEKVFPIPEGKKVEDVDFSKIEADAAKKTNAKYGLAKDQLEVKYTKEADEKFVPVKLNDETTVKYRLGREKIVEVTGIYRGFNRYHNGIVIGSETVPVFDLLPDDRVKFVTDYRNVIKLNYVNDKVREYFRVKEVFYVQFITDSIKEIGKRNVAAGFIYSWNKWRTPVDVATWIFKYHLLGVIKGKKKIAEEQAEKNQSNGVHRLDKNAPVNQLKKNINESKATLNELSV